MPRVSCVECQGPVVVDPQGLCPEGHYVGTSGARVEQAMGSSSPHPDEPQPWVFTILPEHLEGEKAEPNGHHRIATMTEEPREARPVQAPGMSTAGEDPASDSLLRELHSLSALDDLADERQRSDEGPPPPPVVETVPSPAPTAHPSPPPRPDSDSIADAFAELSALDSSEEPAPTPPPVPSVRPAPSPTTQPPAASGEPTDADHATEDDFAALFGDALEPAPEPPASEEPADGGAHVDEAAPAPESRRGALRAVPDEPPMPPAPEPEDVSTSPDPSPAPAAPALDLTSFTAKGGATGRNGRGRGRRSRR